jgi:hypothetical protein
MTTTDLSEDLMTFFIHQPGVDEGLANGATVAVLQRLYHQRPQRLVEYPERRRWWLRPLDVTLCAGEGPSETLAELARSLGGTIQTWMDLYELRMFDRPRLLVTWGGKVSRGFRFAAPSSELRERLAQAKRQPLDVRWGEDARAAYHATMRALEFMYPSEVVEAGRSRLVLVSNALASGSESGVVTTDVVAAARWLSLKQQAVAWERLTQAGMFGHVTSYGPLPTPKHTI